MGHDVLRLCFLMIYILDTKVLGLKLIIGDKIEIVMLKYVLGKP